MRRCDCGVSRFAGGIWIGVRQEGQFHQASRLGELTPAVTNAVDPGGERMGGHTPLGRCSRPSTLATQAKERSRVSQTWWRSPPAH